MAQHAPVPIPAPITEVAERASRGTLPALVRQLRGLGGCARPIRLDGHRTDVDRGTGEILRHFRSVDLPAGRLLVRCNNRRVTRCPTCAETYRRDTFQLITAGLRGGKGVPEQGGRASESVRHLHGSVVRPGAQPAGLRAGPLRCPP